MRGPCFVSEGACEGVAVRAGTRRSAEEGKGEAPDMRISVANLRIVGKRGDSKSPLLEHAYITRR